MRPTICSVIALQRLSGKSTKATLAALRKHDPKACAGYEASCETAVQTWALLAASKDLGLRYAPVIHKRVGTDDTLTPKSVKNLIPGFTGYIFVDGHVMPSVRGSVENINGYGSKPVTLLVKTARKR